MNRISDDNTLFVLKKTIKKFRIKVSEKTIRNFLYAHPYYPTLKSVCDALKKWKIEHYPLKLELSEIKELELPFIAHINELGGQLVFVEKIGKDKVEYFIQNNKRQIADFDEFARKLSGAVVLIEPNQNILEPNYRQDEQNRILEKMILPFSIFSVLLVSLYGLIPNLNSGFQNGLIFIGLLLIAVLGIGASVLLVMHEFKIHTSMGDKLCSFSSKTDCDSVLSSDASRLFGIINWADAGLVYFIGTFIFLSGSGSLGALSYLAVISALSLPYPVFSIYYQAIKLKKWCPFCLLVQLLIVGEFVVMLQVFKNLDFFGFDLVRLITSFFLPAVIWTLYKIWKEKASWGDQQYNSLLVMKRNPELFRSLLTSSSRVKFVENESDLILGNAHASITITAFLSLYCNPCASAFKKMEDLVESCPDVRINAIFSIYEDEETQKLINTLYQKYKTKGSVDTLHFLSDWYSLPIQSRKSLYENEIIAPENNIAAKIGERNIKLFAEYQVAGTPTVFINRYKYPKQYEYDDIEYFIEDIKQITLESKRQEAYAH